jgi:hypothetical protein
VMCAGRVTMRQEGVLKPHEIGLERETGLEPATPCLEGTAPSLAAGIIPLVWRKVASHARSRPVIRRTVGRVTVNEPNQGAVYSFAGISCNALPESLSTVSAQLSRVSHQFRRVLHSSRSVSLRRRQMCHKSLQEGNGMRAIGKELRQGMRMCDASLHDLSRYVGLLSGRLGRPSAHRSAHVNLSLG